MLLYVVSSKYQTLVTYHKEPNFFNGYKSITHHDVSKDELIETFEKSKGELIACDNRNDALIISSLLMKKNLTKPELVAPNIHYVSTVIVYTVDIDELELAPFSKLTGSDLKRYTQNSFNVQYFDEKLKSIDPICYRKIQNTHDYKIISASFYNSDKTILTHFDLTTQKDEDMECRLF